MSMKVIVSIVDLYLWKWWR